MSTEKKSPKLTVAVLIALLLGAVGVITATSCRTTQPLVDDVAHIAADCGKPAVRDIATRILDDVLTALVTADYGGGIRAVVTGLVRDVAESQKARALDTAWQAASCAVAEVERQASTQLGYGHMDVATTERQQMIQAHASAWLAGHR